MTTPDNGFAEITHRELGLRRQLTSGQMSMIAIGGAIGTGLFMGSAYAIGYAGPSVLVSYAIGALITLLLMGCLAEMTVAHSTSGSFGVTAVMPRKPRSAKRESTVTGTRLRRARATAARTSSWSRPPSATRARPSTVC